MPSKSKQIKQIQSSLEVMTKKYKKNNEDKLILANVLATINSELEESLSNEKRFIASVSHELRTPMTSIIGYSELMCTTSLNSQQKRYMQSISQSSSYLLSLVNDLLDVAKFKDKRVELSPKMVEFNEVVTECATLMESKIAKGVNFDVQIPLLDYFIKVDDKRLKQIILNLLSNAAKFTKKGRIKFSVDPVVEYPNGQIQIIMHIEDSGIGIGSEVIETLFDPFYSTDKTQGTGLGLFISQELAHLMKGDITVSSVEGIGSHFTLKIFVEKAQKKELGKGLLGSNILMCSAKNSMVNSMIMELKKMGVDGFSHHDLENAEISELLTTHLSKAKDYNMVIFDVDYLKEDTLSIARMFSLINPNIKIIAYLNDDNKTSLEQIDLILYKPLGYQKFIKKIEKFYTKGSHKKSLKKDYTNLNILLVEDVELNRIYQVEMLKKFFDIVCDTAENGAIAVKKAKENHYDAILMDMRMPVMNGLEATRKIREFDQGIPIICMSANVYKEDKIAAEESGMNDFIEKPLERSDIENRLLKVINNTFHIEKVEEINYNELAYQFLRENFDEAMTKKLCQTAKDSLNQGINNVESFCQEVALDAMVEEFHRMKGVLLNLGLKTLSTQAGELQKYAEDEALDMIIEKKEELLGTLKGFVVFTYEEV